MYSRTLCGGLYPAVRKLAPMLARAAGHTKYVAGGQTVPVEDTLGDKIWDLVALLLSDMASLTVACLRVGIPVAVALGILAYNSNNGLRAEWRAAQTNQERPAVAFDVRQNAVARSGILRLRRRQAWTNSMVHMLGLNQGRLGAFLAGRWTPDLTGFEQPGPKRFISALLLDGARVLGGGFLATTRQVGAEVVHGRTPYLRLGLGVSEHTVLVDALAKLSLYSCYRRRDQNLVAALRVRCTEWCRDNGINDQDAALLLPSTVALAFLRSSPEEAGSELLRARSLEDARWGAYVQSTKERYWYESKT
jgi:hypothetical protein